MKEYQNVVEEIYEGLWLMQVKILIKFPKTDKMYRKDNTFDDG